MYSLRMSAWMVPPSCSAETPCALGHAHVLGEHDRGRRVHRHRGGDLVERDAPEQVLHVGQRVDGDALAADLAQRAGVVRVVAHQGGHVEGGREAGLAVLEQVAEPPVGLLGGAEAGELAHRPGPAAVHRLVDAAGERVAAGITQVAVVVDRRRLGRIQRLQRDAGDGRVLIWGCAVGVGDAGGRHGGRIYPAFGCSRKWRRPAAPSRCGRSWCTCTVNSWPFDVLTVQSATLPLTTQCTSVALIGAISWLT